MSTGVDKVKTTLAALIASIVLIMGIVPKAAYAQETTSYTYDAKGRLTVVSHAGGPANGVTSNYTYDPADNRTNVTVTGGVSQPTFSIQATSANEGAPLVFNVSLAGAAGAAFTVNYTTSNGTALAGTNYTATSGSLSFPSGVTSSSFSVPTIADGVYTPSLTMTATLSSASSGAVIGTASATGTILNTDAQPISNIAIASASANEGAPLSFVVTRSGNTSSAVSVGYATANGSAIAGANYTGVSGTISFAAGVTSQVLNVSTIDDFVITPNLGMTAALSSPSSGAAITSGVASGTIVNIDSGWATSLTSGSYSFCYYSCYAIDGYVQGWIGSITNATWNGYTISALDASSGQVYFQLTGTSTPPNSGWTSITVPGVGPLNRSAGIYTISGTSAYWTWSSANIVASGTVVIDGAASSTIVNNNPGWTSTLTSGNWGFCYYTCSSFDGYIPSLMGAMSNTTYNGNTITGVYDAYGQIFFTMSGSATPPNSGWTSITVPGVGTFTRASGTYTASGTYSYWSWPSASTVTSGVVTIQ